VLGVLKMQRVLGVLVLEVPRVLVLRVLALRMRDISTGSFSTPGTSTCRTFCMFSTFSTFRALSR
jgi:hypothetical protein